MSLLHQCGNGHWMGSLDSECIYLQRTLDCKKKTSTSPKSRERFRKTGFFFSHLFRRFLGSRVDVPHGVPQNRTGYHKKRRETDGQKERERGREDAVLYEKGG